MTPSDSIVGRLARVPLPSLVRRPLRWVYLAATRSGVSARRRAGPDVRSAADAGDPAKLQSDITQYLEYRRDVEDALSPSVRPNPEVPLWASTGPQSTQFMVDLLPQLQRYLATTPRGRIVDVLDVGPGNGHGTALLSSLYSSARLGYSMRITATDIIDHYHNYIRVIAPRVRLVVQDIYSMGETFNIVIASHVIEHVPDPLRFSRQLQALATECAFIVAPYQEPRDRLTKGHRNVIDAALIDQLNADEVTIMRSVAWGAFYDPPYEMVIARLPGTCSGGVG